MESVSANAGSANAVNALPLSGYADADQDDSNEFSQSRSHNVVNEITNLDFSGASAPVDRAPKYNARGDMTSDDTAASGVGRQYVYDAFGRMTKVKDNPVSPGTPATLAEFKYDANNQRVAWRHSTGAGGAGGDGMWYYPVYDHRWRMIEVRRDESGTGGSAQARYERFYYHNAGVVGSGNASYIDSVIRRDRNAVVATSGPETLEETFYYLQNWRGDVVSMMSANGSRSEQVRYTSYGRPMRLTNGSLQADFDGNNAVEVADIFAFLNAWFAQFNVCTGPSCSADIDGNDLVEVADIFAFLNNWFSSFGSPIINFDSLSTLGNRKGYAGYEHDPLWPTMMHVRHRVYRADLGTWMRRDPIGYVDGANLHGYVGNEPITNYDYLGLMKCTENNHKNGYSSLTLSTPDTSPLIPEGGSCWNGPDVSAALSEVLSACPNMKISWIDDPSCASGMGFTEPIDYCAIKSQYVPDQQIPMCQILMQIAKSSVMLLFTSWSMLGKHAVRDFAIYLLGLDGGYFLIRGPIIIIEFVEKSSRIAKKDLINALTASRRKSHYSLFAYLFASLLLIQSIVKKDARK